MSDLFSTLRYVDDVPGDTEGEEATFDVSDVPHEGEHFVSRLREYLPLFEVWTRNVVTKTPRVMALPRRCTTLP